MSFWGTVAAVITAKVLWILIDEFITVKGIKALGNQLSKDKIRTINITIPEPEEEEVIEPKPIEQTKQEVVIEGLKHLFVTQSIDTRIESALPLLAKIQQQGNAMKEANIFEAWAERLVEGTWQLPDTPEKQQQLVELMSQDLPVGADATNATEQLYELLGGDTNFTN